MALTRKQELFLMQIGIQTLHEGIQTQKELKEESSKEKKPRKTSKSKKHWTQTPAGRKRISEQMRKRWIDRQKSTSK